MRCSDWERLINEAERSGNREKALEFREKFVECIVYTAQELIARGRTRDLVEAENLLNYGEDVGRKLGINELLFHIGLLRKRIEEKRGRRRPREASAKPG
ncbi:hypothetical protein [Vulcanisaeta thermophila]|uniref:hypothetical protein n=1 Tax=Vulcanisaeta thermophila TaxID=867917 RepID=UPI0008539948|nr:hypothetical protein [Vulcanisaeta thermophila]